MENQEKTQVRQYIGRLFEISMTKVVKMGSFDIDKSIFEDKSTLFSALLTLREYRPVRSPIQNQ